MSFSQWTLVEFLTAADPLAFVTTRWPSLTVRAFLEFFSQAQLQWSVGSTGPAVVDGEAFTAVGAELARRTGRIPDWRWERAQPWHTANVQAAVDVPAPPPLDDWASGFTSRRAPHQRDFTARTGSTDPGIFGEFFRPEAWDTQTFRTRPPAYPPPPPGFAQHWAASASRRSRNGR